MKILCNNEIDRSEWKNLQTCSQFSSPFQTPEYFDFYNSCQGHSAKVYAVSENGQLFALVIVTFNKEPGLKAFFSRRAIIYGGPLFIDGKQDEAFYLLKNIVDELSKSVIFIETRNFFDYTRFKTSFLMAGFNYSPWLNYQVDTSEWDIMISSISSTRMRQIRKAKKNGTYWVEAVSLTEVNEFYEILKTLYLKKIKKPLMPYDFFLKFFNQKMGKFFLVKLNNSVIGGIMCLIMENKAVYEFYICGLDSEYKEHYPSVMATWAAMEYAHNHQIPMFDFMGAGSPLQNYGVRDFKARFGGQQVEHGRFIQILHPLLYKIGKLGLKFLYKFK